MGSKEEEDFYLNLSKKELQCLCKKYGLSPYKTKFNLVKSLVSYLQKKTMSSLTSCERLSCEDNLLPRSLMPQRQLGSQLHYMVDGSSDNHAIISERREVKNDNLLQALGCNNLESFTGADTCDKASCNGISEGFGCTGYNHQETSHTQCAFQYDGSNSNYDKEIAKINYDNNKLDSLKECERFYQNQSGNKSFGASTTDHALANPMKSTPKVPSSSFEFYVKSEEGIKLCVDLNVSPSDWSARLKNGVCISQSVQNNKSRSLQQTFGQFGNKNNHSLLWNTNSTQKINDGITQSRSSPSSTVIENGQDGTDVSLRSSAPRPYSTTVDFSRTLEEDQVLLLSSGPGLNIQGRMSGTESCPRDEGTLIVDSGASDTLRMKTACDVGLNMASDGARSLDTLEHQISEVDNGPCENSTLRIPYSIVDTGVVVPGCFTSGSMEGQLLEIATPLKDVLRPSNDIKGFLYRCDPACIVEAEPGELTNRSKLHNNTCRNNLPSSAEELARSNLIHRRESSECPQFDNYIDKVFLRCDLEFSERLQKKRQCDDDQDNKSSGKPDAQMFKSFKYHTDEVFPRRSMRLINK